jgi:hypothetical protein
VQLIGAFTSLRTSSHRVDVLVKELGELAKVIDVGVTFLATFIRKALTKHAPSEDGHLQLYLSGKAGITAFFTGNIYNVGALKCRGQKSLALYRALGGHLFPENGSDFADCGGTRSVRSPPEKLLLRKRQGRLRARHKGVHWGACQTGVGSRVRSDRDCN